MGGEKQRGKGVARRMQGFETEGSHSYLQRIAWHILKGASNLCLLTQDFFMANKRITKIISVTFLVGFPKL